MLDRRELMKRAAWRRWQQASVSFKALALENVMLPFDNGGTAAGEISAENAR